jgi:hypothetical protein
MASSLPNNQFFEIGGITLQVMSDLPIHDTTFNSAINQFQTNRETGDRVYISHYFFKGRFSIPDTARLVYNTPPWEIYDDGQKWYYNHILPPGFQNDDAPLVVFLHDYSRADVYHTSSASYTAGDNDAVSLLTSDQVLLAQCLANRSGLMIHGSGLSISEQGLAFIGQSTAGKSTITRLLTSRISQQSPLVLSDERIILRKIADEWKLAGTWIHSQVEDTSPVIVPLRRLFLLEQSDENTLIHITNRKEIIHRILPRIIKPHITKVWWNQTLNTLEHLVDVIPVYELRFTLSGEIVPLIIQNLED